MRPIPFTSIVRRLPGAHVPPLRLLSALAVAALALTACSSSSGAGWTYAPTPPSTPAPSVAASPGGSGAAASGSPVASGSAALGSASPASGASNPAASGAGTGTTLSLAAQNIAYDKQSLQAPANVSFTIAFNNEDQGVPHNVSIHKDSPTGQEIFKGDIVTGPAQTSYTIPALAPGTYGFVCTVHPNMTGTLTVQ